MCLMLLMHGATMKYCQVCWSEKVGSVGAVVGPYLRVEMEVNCF